MRLAMRLIDLTNHPPGGRPLWITLWITILRLFKKISACRWTNVSGYLYTGNIQRKRQLMLKINARKPQLPKVWLLSFTNGDEVAVVTYNVQSIVNEYRSKGHALVDSKPVA